MLLLFSCENDMEDVRQFAPNKENLPALTSISIEIFYTDSSQLKAKLKSPLLQEFNGIEPYSEMPNGVKIEFYDGDGMMNSKLSSNYAIHYKNSDEMLAKGNVEVLNRKGEKLNTEKLIWDNRKKILRTDAFVKITTKDEVIYGEGLEANEDFSRYKILVPQGNFNLREN